MNPEIDLLLHLLDEAYEKKAWHGPNLKGILRGVRAAEAAWRPAPGRHCVWELALHAAYWKYAVWRRLTGATRGSFPLEGSNWFERPTEGLATEAAWAADRRILDRCHRDLRSVVAAFPASALRKRAKGSAQTPLRLIAGAAAHDLYHAGQMQLVKRLYPGG